MEGAREITREDTMQWETIEHNHYRKKADWYWVVGIIALAIVVASFLYGNITFALLILIGTVALFLESNRDPEILKVGFDNNGIYVNKNHYPYETLDSFCIEEVGFPRILIKSKKLFMPLIVIPLGDIHPDDVKYFLGYYLDQEKHEESLFQILIEYLGF